MQKSIGLWMYRNDNGFVIQERLVNELKSLGYKVINNFDMRKCFCFNGNVYTEDGINLSSLDVLYHMNADEQSLYQNEILRAIEMSGVKIFNNYSAYSTARDKFISNLIMRNNGIRVPDALLINENLTEYQLSTRLEGWDSFVVKPRTNHGGNGIIKFDNKENFFDFYQATQDKFDNYYIEKYIEFGGHDYRAEIFDGEIVGGYSRKIKKHSFKTNVSAGGEMIPIPVDAEVEKIALKAAEILDVTTTIVDMLRSTIDNQLYVLEVNPIMGIFAEAALKGGSKTPVIKNVHPLFCNDDIKLKAIVRHINKLCEMN